MQRHCEYSFVSCFPTPASSAANFWSVSFFIYFFFNARWCAYSTSQVNFQPQTFSLSVCPSHPPNTPVLLLYLHTSNFWGFQNSLKEDLRLFPSCLSEMCMGRMQKKKCCLGYENKMDTSFAIYSCRAHTCNCHLHVHNDTKMSLCTCKTFLAP